MKKKKQENGCKNTYEFSINIPMPKSQVITALQMVRLEQTIDEYHHIIREIEAECKRKELSIFNLGMLTQRLLINTVDLEKVTDSFNYFELVPTDNKRREP